MSRLTKVPRIASEQERKDVSAFKAGHRIRISKAIKNIYRLPVKYKKPTPKKRQADMTMEEIAKRLGITM